MLLAVLSYRDTPLHPVREVIKAFVGVYPPWYVKGYFLSALSEDDWQKFNDWLGPRIKPQWLTNYGFTDAVDKQVKDAIDNGNIPPLKESEYYESCHGLVWGRQQKDARSHKSRGHRQSPAVPKGKNRR